MIVTRRLALNSGTHLLPMSPNVGSTQGTRCAPRRLFSGDARFGFLTGSRGPGARVSGQEVGSVVSEAGLSVSLPVKWEEYYYLWDRAVARIE